MDLVTEKSVTSANASMLTEESDDDDVEEEKNPHGTTISCVDLGE